MDVLPLRKEKGKIGVLFSIILLTLSLFQTVPHGLGVGPGHSHPYSPDPHQQNRRKSTEREPGQVITEFKSNLPVLETQPDPIGRQPSQHQA